MGSGNPVVLVLYEVLEIFKVMMRQLKITQKEMKKRVLMQQQQQQQETIEIKQRQRSRSPLLNYQDPQVIKSSQSSNFYQNKHTNVVPTLQTNHTSENDVSEYHNLTTRRKSYDLPLKKSMKKNHQQPLSERQRLELYELRAAALREID